MRIIAGKAGGRRLKTPDTMATRPATDRVREAVFSSLGSRVKETRVADLYAGTGSFGLEALSRGAASAVFVENGRKALSALKSNVSEIGIGGEVVARSVSAYLATADVEFDLVFIDPPWPLPTADLDESLAALDRMLAPGALVVTSRRASDQEPNTPETWRVAANKRYGDTRIIRYEKVDDDDDGTLSREF